MCRTDIDRQSPRPGGGIGRRGGLKPPSPQGGAGSKPAPGTNEAGPCSATPGYDAVTGLGVMDLYELAQRLKAVLAQSE